jgi:hypothetical protein
MPYTANRVAIRLFLQRWPPVSTIRKIPVIGMAVLFLSGVLLTTFRDGMS